MRPRPLDWDTNKLARDLHITSKSQVEAAVEWLKQEALKITNMGGDTQYPELVSLIDEAFLVEK